MITITKGPDFKMILGRKELIDIVQSPDGLVFQFEKGTHLYYTDSNMPPDVKENIKNTFLTFKNGDILIDLNTPYYKNIISVTIKN